MRRNGKRGERAARARVCTGIMSVPLRAQWQELKEGEPGQRFRAHRRRARRRATGPGRVWRIVIAVVLLAIGVVLVFIPGPAVLFFALAGALLAGESAVVARWLDGGELHARAAARWSAARWRRMAAWQRAGVVTLATAVALTAAGVAWRWMAG